MYVVRFLTLIFLLNVIPNLSGTETASPPENSKFVTNFLQTHWEGKEHEFWELPSRPVVLDLLNCFVEDPKFFRIPLKESGTGVGANNLSTQNTVQNNATNASENAGREGAGGKMVPSVIPDASKISLITVTTVPRLLKDVLQELANSSGLENSEVTTNLKQWLELSNELLNHEEILPYIETLTAEFYVKALGELYSNIKDENLPDLYSYKSFGMYISNKDFPYLAADIVMAQSHNSSSIDAVKHVVDVMGEHMNLKKLTEYLSTTTDGKVKHVVSAIENKEKTVERSKTVENVIKEKQTEMNGKIEREKSNKDPKTDPRTLLFEKIQKVLEGKSLETEKKREVPLSFLDLMRLQHPCHDQGKVYMYDLEDFIKSVGPFLIQRKPSQNNSKPTTVEPDPNDVIMLLDVNESYANKSIIATILMSKLQPKDQKIVFGQFFGRKLSELIAQLTQNQRIELLKNFFRSIISDQQKTLNCISEIVLRFPHLLKANVAKAAAIRRLPHWNTDKIKSLSCKLKEINAQPHTDSEAERAVNEIKTVLLELFPGMDDNVLNGIPNSTTRVDETTAKKSDDDYKLFFGKEFLYSQFRECLFTGIPMFGEKHNVTCHRAEKWMMLNKALLFGDNDVAGLIEKMTSPEIDPKLFKEFSRVINNFNQGIWNSFNKEIVYQGNALKFAPGTALHEEFKTGLGLAKGFAEATTEDQIYAIGLEIDDPRAKDRSNCRGDNTLGDALTDLWHDMFPKQVSNVLPIKIPYPRYVERKSAPVPFSPVRPDEKSIHNDDKIWITTANPISTTKFNNNMISVQ